MWWIDSVQQLSTPVAAPSLSSHEDWRHNRRKVRRLMNEDTNSLTGEAKTAFRGKAKQGIH